MIVLLYTGAIFVHYVHLAVYAVLTEHSAAFILLFYIRSSDLAVEASAQSYECAQVCSDTASGEYTCYTYPLISS